MRTIREEEEYTRSIKALRINYQRLDSALGDMAQKVRSHPDEFPALPGWRLHRIRIKEFPGLPELAIFFTYDDDMVYLLDACLVPDEEE